jgi:hypothetical protein
MTDIVERLRWTAIHGTQENAIDTMREAAAEIARLAADLGVAETNLNIAKANLHSERLINERLREALQDMLDMLDGEPDAARAGEPKP